MPLLIRNGPRAQVFGLMHVFAHSDWADFWLPDFVPFITFVFNNLARNASFDGNDDNKKKKNLAEIIATLACPIG
jgi:hypothetical protein